MFHYYFYFNIVFLFIAISYLTIEHRSEITDELKPQIGNWLYGCDICQDVCPWNRKSPAAIDPTLQPRFANGTLDVEDVAAWTPEDYSKQLRGSAMRRVKLPVLKRNAEIVRANDDTNKRSTRCTSGAPVR